LISGKGARADLCVGLKYIFIALCLLFSFCGVQAQTNGGSNTGTAAGQVSPEMRGQLLKLLPDPLPAQAKAAKAPAFYAANLWEYMDGAADQFQVFGLQGMLHQDFQAGQVSVVVDLFQMGKPENAFGMYATERSEDAQFVSIGTEGVHGQSSEGDAATLNFFLDRYYVKLSAFGAGSAPVLDAFARGIATRIGARPEWPGLLAKFPTEHRQPHTEQYVQENALGHDFLGAAYSAKYLLDKNESTLVVSLGTNEAEALHRLDLLEKHLRKDGQCAAAPELGGNAIRGKTSYEGEIIARTVGSYLVLMVNPAGSANEIFQQTINRLK
jgi:hypothetical protein